MLKPIAGIEVSDLLPTLHLRKVTVAADDHVAIHFFSNLDGVFFEGFQTLRGELAGQVLRPVFLQPLAPKLQSDTFIESFAAPLFEQPVNPARQTEDVAVKKQVLLTLKLKNELIAQVDIEKRTIGQFSEKLILLAGNIVDLGPSSGQVHDLLENSVGFLVGYRILASASVDEIAVEDQYIRRNTFEILNEFAGLAGGVSQVYI